MGKLAVRTPADEAILQLIRDTVTPKDIKVLCRAMGRYHRVTLRSRESDWLGVPVGDIGGVLIGRDKLTLRTLLDDGHTSTPATVLWETVLDLADPNSITELEKWLLTLSPKPDRRRLDANLATLLETWKTSKARGSLTPYQYQQQQELQKREQKLQKREQAVTLREQMVTQQEHIPTSEKQGGSILWLVLIGWLITVIWCILT